MSQYIDKGSIYKHFPANIPVPSKLVEFLDWLDSTIDDAGWFPEFVGESFDEYGSSLDEYKTEMNLSQHFGIFAHLGDGSLLAYWFYEGCDTSSPPIVMLDSEGDLQVVVESVEELVARLIDAKFPDELWADRLNDFYFYPDETWIDKLEVWAEQTWNLTAERRKSLTLSVAETRHPSLEKWLDDKLQRSA
jgi:hypothetical protein